MGAGASLLSRYLAPALCLAALLLHQLPAAVSAPDPSRGEVLAAMRSATTYMMDRVSHRGGFVWYYLPDGSRRWGELEARDTMIWIQPPGTATVGHVLLDAWHASGDAVFLAAAHRVADALVAAQHPSGGWNYLHDFAGEGSLREWYATIGANAWRLEEFHHYLGNATFDDGGTAEAGLFLLRLAQAGGEPRHLAACRRALDFVLSSQYPQGGWPQRYPPVAHNPIPYTRHTTLNDDVALGNIRLLLLAYRVLGDAKYKAAAVRGMYAFLELQQPPPQAGWALQYTPDGKPAAARTYEPAALSPAATARVVGALLVFYTLTGDRRFLKAVPPALDWLEVLALPPAQVVDGRSHPRVVEPGSNRPLYIHRSGSNVVNGRYYLDYRPGHTVSHYPSTGHIPTGALRERYAQLREQADREAAIAGIESNPALELPLHYIRADTLGRVKGSPVRLRDEEVVDGEAAAAIIGSLHRDGYWPSTVTRITHPYSGPGLREPPAGDFRSTLVGDSSDTSPFLLQEAFPVIAIDAYIANMARLIRYLEVDQSSR